MNNATIYTEKELETLGFQYKCSYADLKVYGRGDLRIGVQPLPDGRLQEYMRYQMKTERINPVSQR